MTKSNTRIVEILISVPRTSHDHFAGGLFCFSMRDLDVKEYEEKMLELEKAGKWQTFTRERIPYSDNDDLPQETNGFIFKVLKN